MRALTRYSHQLEKKPILTKCITSFCTFGLGDLISQYLEKKNTDKPWEWVRFIRQASFGFVIAPYFHLNYCVISPRFFGGSSKGVLMSVIYDQTVSVCIFTSLFFTYLDTTSGKSLQQATDELKVKMLPTLLANWKVWPFIMLINFTIIPIPFRVFYTNICGMFWAAYLSYVQNVKAKKQML